LSSWYDIGWAQAATRILEVESLPATSTNELAINEVKVRGAVYLTSFPGDAEKQDIGQIEGSFIEKILGAKNSDTG
jgi:hypothetical protein